MCIDGTHLSLGLTLAGTLVAGVVGFVIMTWIAKHAHPALALLLMVLCACGIAYIIIRVWTGGGFTCQGA